MDLNGEELLRLQEYFLRVTSSEEGSRDGWYEPESRGGIFGQALTIWMWMLQTMTGSSMSAAIGKLHEGAGDLVLSHNPQFRRIQTKGISASTGGYARARQRLPEVDVADITKAINDAIHSSIAVEDGQRKYFLDGTLVTLARTAELDNEYGRPTGAYGKRNHPLMRVVFATDVKSAVSVEPSFGGYRDSEQKLSVAVLDTLEEGSLIIADRNFGVFSVVSHATTKQKEVLVRLSSQKAHKFLKGEKSRGFIDKTVVWDKSYRDTLLDEQDLSSLKGRFIRAEIRRPGFALITLYLFTTSSLPPQELIALYGKRVDIETDIRQLKALFAMEQLLVKTPEMVRKHILILFAAHNLLRAVIANASAALNLLPRQISFKNAVMYVRIYAEKINRATNRKEKQMYYSKLLTALKQSKLPIRKKARSEPRMLTRRRSHFPLIIGSRSDVKKRLKLS